ncbi:SecDF P1 head subdomain-containing protein [Mesorhizobium sp. ORM8.1]
MIGLALVSMILGASTAFAADQHILFRLNPSDLIKSRLEATRDEIGTLLRGAQSKIDYTGLAASDRAVQMRITDANQLEAAKSALKTVTGPRADSGIQEMALDDSEPGLLKFTMTDAGVKYRTSAALKQSIEVIKNRLRDLSVADAVTRQAGEDGILVEAPGATDLQGLGKTLNRPGRLSFQLVDTSMPVNDAINGRPPAGSSVLYTLDDPPTPYLVENRVLVSGNHVLDANATHNAVNDEPVVSFRFDSRGAERFEWATRQYVGKPFAVILDDQVISAPIIRETVKGGTGQISGNFTDLEARTIALLMRTGALPARLTIVEEAR